jgi:MFS transporter, PPP family, 3-phenylpropionic acid transporter
VNQLRTSLYYFVQFFSGGAFHAYGGIWFASKGFSATEIGALNSFPIFLVLVSNIFVGRIADRASDWRQVIVVGAIASFMFSTGLLVSDDYYPIFAFWSLALVAQSLIVPVGDGAAMFLTQQGRAQIGTLRGLSTVGYLVSLFVTGYVIQGFGGAAFALLFVGFSAMRALGATLLPHFKTLSEQGANSKPLGLSLFCNYFLSLPLLGWSIVYATHQVLNSFIALLFKQQGIAESTIGWLLASGAMTEALVFFLFQHVAKRFDLRLMILLSCSVAVVRWLAMAQEPSLPILFGLQLLHGITYALGFVSCVSFIGRHTSSGNAAEAQSLFNVMQMVSAIVVITLFGGLVDAYGSKAYYGSAGVALIGALVAVYGLGLREREISR